MKTSKEIAAELLAQHDQTKANEGASDAHLRKMVEMDVSRRGGHLATEMLAHGGGDSTSATRRAAAMVMSIADQRPIVRTRYGQHRREVDDMGSITRRIAQAAIDRANFYGDYELPEADRQAGELHRFARETNAATHENTLPVGGSIAPLGSKQWSDSASAVASAIAKGTK